jgi:deoxyribodipyrimidine photo-lyase
VNPNRPVAISPPAPYHPPAPSRTELKESRVRSLIWFRNDLRTTDNTALLRAAASADEGVIGLYVISPGDWQAHDTAASRVDFVLRTLEVLSRDLAELGIPLLIRTAKKPGDIPALVQQVMTDTDCAEAHINLEYEINERKRDRAVGRALEKVGFELIMHHDLTAVPPGAVLTQQGHCHTVFTPFRKAWHRVVEEEHDIAPGSAPAPCDMPRGLAPDDIPGHVPGFDSSVPADCWPAGESEACARLDRFLDGPIMQYHEQRDFPAIQGTSTLSPYLAVGAISPRTCLAAAADINGGQLEGPEKGPNVWVSELIWREFYKHILAAYPRVCMHRPFRPETDRIEWLDDDEGFAAWCEGRTGYPVVDAAMRQLRATGWMHNRLRMVAAMFLTKDLFIDWRRGEQFFMQHLIDGDLAANNGGWQWSASTGTDAAPYFRIFNPASQSKRYDPEGDFIRAYVPELESLSKREIHEPAQLAPLARANLDYPEPIVDHAMARQRAIDAFKAIK